MNQEIDLFKNNIETVQSCGLLDRKQEIKRIIEGLLFSCNDPLSLDKIREVIYSSYPLKSQELIELIHELKKEYSESNRAFKIDYIAQGYLLRTVEDVHPYIELLHQNRRSEKLTKAAIEVLAIIAHKQPITRGEIEKIRGVDSTGSLSSLMERELIEVVGRKESPGRPTQYGITKRFLHHFGLNNIQEITKTFFGSNPEH
jgi:segregation and condensation protein B